MPEFAIGIDTAVAGTRALFNGLLYVIFAAVGVLGIWYLSLMMQFKHKLRVREVVNGRMIVFDDKAREMKTKEGLVQWQRKKNGHRMDPPPPEAIEIDRKGRKCVEVYNIGGDRYVYAIDSGKASELNIKKFDYIKDPEKRKKAQDEWCRKNNIIAAFEPYNSTQRTIMVTQHRKAIEKKRKNWQELILPIAGLASLTILVISLMIFWGDMAEPLLQMADKLKGFQEVTTEQLEILRDIKNDIQTIQSQLPVDGGTAAPPEPPN